ncbi:MULTISPECIES: c-type cytochrome biogenesis protein CcmI [Rhodopseudomonas]|uniref:Cytochrome C biogenesis protein n=1 Tax=Rhodopseudomonas palustris TaxID=1076 RepID=A0A0D7EQ58_RHOPL|nr:MULTISPECIES: c-type cytochrome biogenesis protein CcmI [Rhodopseudomonas]KIZ42954.1 cytochrome C biogenesis protein [Rhodopseudomonas palustris]MDF3813978.1 c-type cytochrome biogenesis protein CcmI [Rhodopseudomonas sp. BAL398]WOK19939.1 c-type cytochrome biogenesis protein CcmI [Rhodopseudomonas sp. BAL398]
MTLWFVFAMMTAAAAFAVLWPLARGGRRSRQGSEANVYKDQLAEIDRDSAAGLIAAPEAAAARVEISRRLLASADSERAPPTSSRKGLRRAVAVIALVGLPALAVAFYLPLGSPRLDDAPLAQRAQAPPTSQPLENLVEQVEAHLEKTPTDGRGWAVLAPVQAKLGRFDDAVRSYRNAITYAGDTAQRRADLGEMITMAAGGVVTDEAKTEFEKALTLNADEVKSHYFLGLAAEQDGRPKDAATIWRALLEKAPADAPWRPMLQAALARVGGVAVPALPDDKVAAAKDMTPADRNAMIRGMVDRLASRLKQNGDDVEGWLRLVRAYMVLGDADKAKDARTQARQAVGGNADTLRRLNDGLKDLGLDG